MSAAKRAGRAAEDLGPNPVLVRAKGKPDSEDDNMVVGYYNHRRIREGEEFYIRGMKKKDGTLQDFSEKWMELVEAQPGQQPGKKPAPARPRPASKREQTESVI